LSLRIPNFANLFELSVTKSTKKFNIFHTLALEIVKINSIKSDLSKAFQQHQERPQIPIQFLVLILFRRILNSHLFWLNSHPFFERPIICRLMHEKLLINLSVSAPTPLMFIWLRNLYYTIFSKYIIILLITFHALICI